MTKSSVILVTGGAGFIGSHLVERLLADGCRVRVIDDLSTGRIENLAAPLKDPHLDFLQARVSECPQLATLANEADFIFHLAAAVGVDLVVRAPIHTISNNLDETESILKAANQRKVPLLLASTSEVYGKSTKAAFSEDDDLLIGPSYLSRWSYACSKLTDEFLAFAYFREAQVPVTVARLFNTVGPRQTGRYGMVLPRFIEAAKAGRNLTVFGDGRQTRCFCDVADTVEALVRLHRCVAARGQIVNVGNDTEISIIDLAHQVIRLLNSTSSIEFIPYETAYAPGFEDMQRRRPVIDKCFRLTGFRPTAPLADIILKTAASCGPPATA